jgi:transaldolase/glucose-6-phosphate isomerase
MPAIRTLTAAGINVNITLIFSLEQYQAVVEAYVSGLEDRLAAGSGDLRVASVASFFVSRVDTAVDAALAAVGARAEQAKRLMGKIAIANAKVAYSYFRQAFSEPRWVRLAEAGAQPQRPLWASTGTKNPVYPDTLYVDALIGPDTVNTVPPATLQAFLHHGTPARTLDRGLREAEEQLQALSELGIDLAAITADLQEQGVEAFARSYADLMQAIAEKRERLLAGWRQVGGGLGQYATAVAEGIAELSAGRILPRIWAHDHTVWKPEPDEIVDRLGWLHSPEMMQDSLHQLEALRRAAVADGYSQALLLGMGGSSLAAEVLRSTFGVQEGGLDLAVLDSTDPAAVLHRSRSHDPARTLYLVSTKSGTTVETLSLFKHFYNLVAAADRAGRTGAHFVAITDPGSRLAELAAQLDFREVFLNDPTIGGRYSALSFFGLVPAVLLGLDLHTLLGRALAAACSADSCVVAADSPAAWLGVAMAELAGAGRDKLTVLASPSMGGFGDWLEQLIAESTGKEGKGILPVVREPVGQLQTYGTDRTFVYFRLDEDPALDPVVESIESAGHPVLRVRLRDPYDSGTQFFTWELATAIAGHRLGIHPFNQPDVEAAKVQARDLVKQYLQAGSLPAEPPSFTDGSLAVFGANGSGRAPQALADFAGEAGPRSYLGLQAYLPPEPAIEGELQSLRTMLRDRTRLATTLGFGPRYLHSTGQMHKGDAGAGLFLQFTADDAEDVPIPDEPGDQASAVSFGVLKAAQALGDRQVLLERGRRVIRFHLGGDALGGLRRLRTELG